MKRTITASRSRLRHTLANGLIAATVIALIAASAIGAKTALAKANPTRAMCADFTDAAGLYPGNKVKLLDVEIGVITAISNKADHVQVDFTVPSDLDLPADVGAVTFSDSIVTDRHVELTKPYAAGPKFTEPRCIALQSTKTPIGVSETLASVSKLADVILGRQDDEDSAAAPGAAAINDALHATSHALDGSGPALKQTLQNLALMIGDPHKTDSDYRQLLESSEVFTSGWLKHWDDFAKAMGMLPKTVRLIGGVTNEFGTALQNIVHLLPPIVEALGRFGPRLYNLGDRIVPWLGGVLNWISPQIIGFINSLTPFLHWLTDDYRPEWGAQNVTYRSPQVPLTPEQASAICERLKHDNPDVEASCKPGKATSPASIGLADLLIGGAL